MNGSSTNDSGANTGSQGPAAAASAASAANTKAPTSGGSRTVSSSSSTETKKKKLDHFDLETNASNVEDEEKILSKATRKASKEISSLLDGAGDDISKITLLQTKYNDLFQDMKRLERDYAKQKSKNELIQKEKESASREVSKTNGAKLKLEGLCRELQKENKRIKDETKKLVMAEQIKRQQLSKEYDAEMYKLHRLNQLNFPRLTPSSKTLHDDTSVLASSVASQTVLNGKEVESSRSIPIDPIESKKIEKAINQFDPNSEQDRLLFKDKFKSFLDQYDLRETHYLRLSRAKELEVKILHAKYEERSILCKREQQKATQVSLKLAHCAQTENELRSQLDVYVDKFKQVEETLNSSNELFQSFRNEMNEMSKKSKKLESENISLKNKHENFNFNLLNMAEDRTKLTRDNDQLKKKVLRLENLCRALQKERNVSTASGNSNLVTSSKLLHGKEGIKSSKLKANGNIAGMRNKNGHKIEKDLNNSSSKRSARYNDSASLVNGDEDDDVDDDDDDDDIGPYKGTDKTNIIQNSRVSNFTKSSLSNDNVHITSDIEGEETEGEELEDDDNDEDEDDLEDNGIPALEDVYSDEELEHGDDGVITDEYTEDEDYDEDDEDDDEEL